MRYEAALREHKTRPKAAKALGISLATFRYRHAQELLAADQTPAVKDATLPDFPNPDAPIDQLIALRDAQFRRNEERHKAETWFQIRIRDALPIGIMCFGDPHLDDDGCNWPLLRHHVDLAVGQPGLYALNIGDTTNNWAGRLARLYAQQDTSERTARRFARWFLAEARIPWLVWLMGNHDLWASGADLLRAMNPMAKLPMLDWGAKFEVVFADGQKVRVHAAHDFPGSSIWNPTHGPLRASQLSSDADVLICGHRHNAASQEFVTGRGKWVKVARASGYKRLDAYAEQLGYENAPDDGAAVLVVLDPSRTGAGRVSVFADVDLGVSVLRALRSEASKRSPPKPAGAARSAKRKPQAAKRRRA